MSTRHRIAVALLAISCLASAAPALAARAYVVESDFSTGSFSSVDVATRVPSCDVASVHSDARVRWYNGRVYVVNRFGADNIEVLDEIGRASCRERVYSNV